MIYINKNIKKEELDTVTKELRHYDWRYKVTDEIAPYDYMLDNELAIISVNCVDELCERLEKNEITNIMDKAEHDDILLTILVNNSKCEFLCDLDDDDFINSKYNADWLNNRIKNDKEHIFWRIEFSKYKSITKNIIDIIDDCSYTIDHRHVMDTLFDKVINKGTEYIECIKDGIRRHEKAIEKLSDEKEILDDLLKNNIELIEIYENTEYRNMYKIIYRRTIYSKIHYISAYHNNTGTKRTYIDAIRIYRNIEHEIDYKYRKLEINDNDTEFIINEIINGGISYFNELIRNKESEIERARKERWVVE